MVLRHPQALLDLATVLSSELAAEALEAALGIVMGEVQASQAAFFVRSGDGTFRLRAARGLPPGAPPALAAEAIPDELTDLKPQDDNPAAQGFALLCPVRRRGRTIAVLGLGPPSAGSAYGEEERAFIRSAAACAAPPLENALLYDELRRVNETLAVRVFELHNLFDASRELTGRSEEDAVLSLIATTVMGHFVVSRCALYLAGPQGLALAYERGLRRRLDDAPIPSAETQAALRDLQKAKPVSEMLTGALRRRLEEARLALAVPLKAGDEVTGVLAIGERASRTPFSAEDREFAETLARQAATALERARLHRLSMEKQRQDHELQLARDIQRSLLPARGPDLPGFEVAAESRSCYEVGGDSYDWIRLDDGRLALTIADVSGKGTPASLLMASVQASVHALAGMADPAALVQKLNRFLFARTETNRYVTLFYGELDTQARRLAYVNAGHIPPYCIAADGTVRRLSGGGLALGLVERAAYEVGQVRLEPGDVVAMVTDGVTEACSPGGDEFGDEQVCQALNALRGKSAQQILEGLVAAVDAWAGGATSHDDLTALVLKAR